MPAFVAIFVLVPRLSVGLAVDENIFVALAGYVWRQRVWNSYEMYEWQTGLYESVVNNNPADFEIRGTRTRQGVAVMQAR